MHRSHVFVALLVLGSAPLLNAQSPLDTVLSRLRSGQTIRVSTRDQGRVQARFLGRQDNAVRFAGTGSPDVLIASIDTVWVRGHATGTVALLGALTLGTVFAVLVSGDCASGSDCSSIEVPVAGAVGVASGALVGALIGRGITTWKRRYAQKGPSVGLQWHLQGRAALTLTYRF